MNIDTLKLNNINNDNNSHFYSYTEVCIVNLNTFYC